MPSEVDETPITGVLRAAVPGILAYFVLIAVLLAATMWLQDGHFIYTLDDPYIHMAMAKNAVEHGVWGATQYESSSCSSSPLWTALLAASYWIGGVHHAVPFALNFAFGVVLIVYLTYALIRYGVAPRRAGFLAPGIAFMANTPANVFTGMEHTLQCVVSLAIAILASTMLSAPTITMRAALPLLVLAPVAASTRYEGLLLVAVVCGLLLLRRAFVAAVAVGSAAWAPIVAYGLWMKSLGAAFLPYSVLLKRNIGVPLFDDWTSYLGLRFVIQFIAAPELLALFVGLTMTWRWKRKNVETPGERGSVLLLIAMGAILLHVEFASTLTAFRYQSYLIVLALFALATTSGPLYETGLRFVRPVRRQALLSIGFPLGRAVVFTVLSPVAGMNIYQQQYQMARFVERYYPDRCVALNDIGAVSYFTDARVLDLWGLATPEVGNARVADQLDVPRMAEIASARNVEIALLYESWFSTYYGFPGAWREVGTWTIPWNVTCGNPTVNFYSVGADSYGPLRAHLAEFNGSLPNGVITKGP